MVATDIAGRDVVDPAVLDAMHIVPRHEFVPEQYRRDAHGDHPLPIGHGQTISQPYMVAVMAELAHLSPHDRVLEVGTGSGYGAAVLRELADDVVTIERNDKIAEMAAATLARVGYDDIEVVTADGTLGHPARAPYDAIIVTAAGPDIPPPLLQQLADGGRLVIPIGKRNETQKLVVCTRRADDLSRVDHGGVRFVPLIGEHGFSP